MPSSSHRPAGRGRALIPRIAGAAVMLLMAAAAVSGAAPRDNLKGELGQFTLRQGRKLLPLNGRKIRATGPYQREYMYWYMRSRPNGVFPHTAEHDAQRRALAHRAAVRARAARGRLRPRAGALLAGGWNELGPRGLNNPIYGPGISSGRVKALLLQKAQNRIIIGAASGGIWKRSLASNAVAVPVADFASNLSIGALAADPNNPNILYAGTGEPGVNVDAFNGDGVLKSLDGGDNWFRVDNGSMSSKKVTGVWVDPRNSQRLLASALYDGLYVSTSGGVSWNRIRASDAMSLAVSPTNPDRILLSNTQPFGGVGGDLLLSTNGGTSFAAVGGPWGGGSASVGRIDLAWSPSDGNVVWCTVAPPIVGTDGGLSGIYRSTDGGSTWTRQFSTVHGTAQDGDQGWYNNPIAVSTGDPNTAYFGGINLYRGTAGGSTTKLTNWFSGAGFPFIHADQHAIAIDPTNANTVYVGNDGGLFVTTNGGTTWMDMNAGLGCVQFYNGAIGMNDLQTVFGGTQDNGSLVYSADPVWDQTLGGDGFQCAVDPQNDSIVFGSIYSSNYFVSLDGGRTFRGLPSLPLLGGEGTPFFSPMTIDPTDGTRIYGGAQRVYRGIHDRAGAVTWTATSGGLLFNNDAVYRIAVARTDGNVIYASGGSRLSVTTTGTDPWTSINPPGGQFISGIAVHPSNPQDVTVCRSGFSGGQVLRSTNGGGAWTDVTGDLPNVPCSNILMREASGRLDTYLATDTGVYYTDLNVSPVQWSPVGTGLPNVHVFDILITGDGSKLVAVTHGRGMFVMQTGPSALTATALSTSTIRLNWQDNTSNETGFEVERRTGAGAFALRLTVPANTTTVTDGLLQSNTQYTYRVRAVIGGGGASGYTNEASALTFPADPSNLQVTTPTPPRGRTELDLQWMDNSASPSAHRVERSDDNGATFREIAVTAIGATTFTDTGLSDGTTYCYRVRAFNTSAFSGYTGVVKGTTLIGPPRAPTALTAVVISNSRINLSWDDDSPVVDGYHVERRVGAAPAFSFVADSATRTFSDTGLTPETTYTYRVIGFNSGGDSPPSRDAGGTTFGAMPIAPTGLTVTPVNQSSLLVAWTDGSNNETGFKLDRSADGGATFAPLADLGPSGGSGTPVSFTDTGLLPNQVYHYRVRATNKGTDSANLGPLPGLTFPAAPDQLTAGATASDTIALSWRDNNGSRPAETLVERKLDGGMFAQIAMVPAGTTTLNDSGLMPNTAYTYRIRATNATGVSAYSAEVRVVSLPSPPAAPDQLRATTLSSTSIALGWRDNADNEDGFIVERAEGMGAFTVAATVGAAAGVGTTVQFTNSGLRAGTTYRFRVLARNTGGNSAPSNEAQATTSPNPPGAPVALTVTGVTATTVSLQWQDGSDNETGFKVQRSTNGTFFTTVGTTAADVVTFMATGLAPGTRYYFRVLATNDGGDSTPSNVVSPTTLPAPPADPSNLRAAAEGPRLVRVEWQDNSTSEITFRVERAQGAGPFGEIAVVVAGVTLFRDSTVQPQTVYTYRVRAVGDGGFSGYSNEATVETPPTPPAAPTDLAVVPLSATSLRVQWTDRSDNETGFEIQRRRGSDPFVRITTVGTDMSEFEDTGLQGNVQYDYRVRAVNAGGQSSYAGPASGLTFPAAPSNLAAAAQSPTSVGLSWRDNNGVPAVTRVERSANGTDFARIADVGPGLTSYVDTGLTPVTPYHYRVRAINGTGNSANAGPVVVTTFPNPPAAPTDLTASEPLQTSVLLRWKDRSNNEAGFSIEAAALGSAFLPVAATGADAEELRLGGLTPATQYRLRVRAFNDGGGSAYTNEAAIATLPTPPAAPSNLTGTVQAGPLAPGGASGLDVRLNWRDNSANETDFLIQRAAGAMGPFEDLATVGANVTTFLDRQVPSLATLVYRVVARNAGGQSAPSNTVEVATPESLPNPPSNLQITLTGSSARLTWTDNSANETGFRVERRHGDEGFGVRVVLPAGSTEHRDDGLLPETPYVYRVYAFNADGDSTPAEQSVRTARGVLSLEIRPETVVGGKAARGVVTLSSPAPRGGLLINLASSHPDDARTPSILKVAAGKTSATFVIRTRRVLKDLTATVTATFQGFPAADGLTILRR